MKDVWTRKTSIVVSVCVLLMILAVGVSLALKPNPESEMERVVQQMFTGVNGGRSEIKSVAYDIQTTNSATSPYIALVSYPTVETDVTAKLVWRDSRWVLTKEYKVVYRLPQDRVRFDSPWALKSALSTLYR